MVAVVDHHGGEWHESGARGEHPLLRLTTVAPAAPGLEQCGEVTHAAYPPRTVAQGLTELSFH